MIKEIFKLLKNIFSKEPFEQTLTFEFGIYDVLFVLLLIFFILRLWI